MSKTKAKNEKPDAQLVLRRTLQEIRRLDKELLEAYSRTISVWGQMTRLGDAVERVIAGIPPQSRRRADNVVFLSLRKRRTHQQ